MGLRPEPESLGCHFPVQKNSSKEMTLGESYGLKNYTLHSFQIFKITHPFHAICGCGIFVQIP